jgi:aldehyde:ferredoxin oxidoreductase
MRAGLGRADDSLPQRLLKEAFKDGPSAGVTVNLEAMLTAYYRERGWDEQGVPTRDKLAELGLENV